MSRTHVMLIMTMRMKLTKSLMKLKNKIKNIIILYYVYVIGNLFGKHWSEQSFVFCFVNIIVGWIMLKWKSCLKTMLTILNLKSWNTCNVLVCDLWTDHMVKDEENVLCQACRRKWKLCSRLIKLSSWCGQTRLKKGCWKLS